jgi:hypothetical protein
MKNANNNKKTLDIQLKTDYNRHIANAMKGNKAFEVFTESCRVVRGSKTILVIAHP